MFALRKIGALKLFILIPNIFGTILAIVMLGVGLVVIINVGKFSMEGNFRQRVYGYVLTIILMAGIILGVVSSLAIIATFKNHRKLFTGYIISVSLLLPLEIGTGVQLLLSGPKIRSELKEYLEDEMKQYDGSNSMKNSITMQIQYHLKCCGVDGYTDWEIQEKARMWPKRKLVPDSCCGIKGNETGKCKSTRRFSSLSKNGCFEEVLESISHPILAVTIICVQFLMLPGSVLLAKAIKDGKTKELF